ncbi:MAG: hypothetical protein KME01_04305 [Chroococcus sp. CMT-3BRIN-NPC107]|jgi:hypothetical protein|nr:hypothetical protein [Chroococcus sp. CMT-3BRIN-NPC107]
MSRNVIVLVKLLFGLSCYAIVGSSFAWTSLWADALGIDEVSNSKNLALPRIAIAVLALTLTWGLAWTKVGVVSWVKVLGWGWILTCGVGLVLGLVTSGITFTVVWIFVVGTAWFGAWSLLSAESQLLLSFSESHTISILAGTGIFGLIVGILGRLGG